MTGAGGESWQDRFEVTWPRPAVALVRLNRPDKLNAMDQRFFAGLIALMQQLGQEGDEGLDETRAIVLTGAGRAFSAGGDIDMFAGLAGRTSAVRPHLRVVYDAFHSVERCPVPVIAAVNGVAFGGGTELALACDIVLAGQAARFAFKEVTVGLSPGFGIVRGPDVIGPAWTRLLALSGLEIGPDRAREIGLAAQVHPDGELVESALDLAAQIAAQPSLAVRVGKAFLNRGTHIGFDESVEAIALLFGTPEHAEAVQRFRSRK
ncbi:MAG: enoyl-CoA hydratase/isomerase family protein [Actinomycetales bacterium]